MATVMVLYPKTTGGLSFDMRYYVSNHMPLVVKIWGPLGLESWEVLSFDNNPDPRYYACSIFKFADTAQAEQSLAVPEASTLFEDVPNFTNITPTVILGKVTGSWSKA
ncbi:hypothetical protein FOMG_17196 [Fusarium oxysporum f. sp. melonis 26406]|uniref:EthD domain-containing protein n=1 Tax=Fusarium oxysporum f. sp. melonis 26406 TaxID=1089452 RepID=W9ZYR7_FUSOX|nr:hypothetical protein FOMG_17196 [Fusarium oxysporum f. sp. melonis 26406]